MGLATLTPTDAPSVPAWKWYEYAQQAPSKFLADFVKRKDAKAKTGDALTDKLVEDDKRMQYGLIDRLMETMTKDYSAEIAELSDRCPDVVVEVLTKRGWKVEPPDS